MTSSIEERHAHFERARDPARVLALSDGVFAIVITLLVLEIHVPDLAQGQSLREALREIRPSFVAFLISFVVTAIAWAGHRDLFTLIRRTDRGPRLAQHPLPAAAVDPAVWCFTDLELREGLGRARPLRTDPVVDRRHTRLAIWWYATGHPDLLHAAIDAQSRRAGVILVGVAAIIYGVAIALAEPAPTISLVIYGAAPVLYFVGITISRASAPEGSAREDFT